MATFRPPPSLIDTPRNQVFGLSGARPNRGTEVFTKAVNARLLVTLLLHSFVRLTSRILARASRGVEFHVAAGTPFFYRSATPQRLLLYLFVQVGGQRPRASQHPRRMFARRRETGDVSVSVICKPSNERGAVVPRG